MSGDGTMLALPASTYGVRGGDMDEDDEQGDEAALLHRDEAQLLLEQLKLLRSTCEGLSAKVNDALHHAQAATVELHGVGGNPGLSQQVHALRERSDATLRSIERELEAARNHSAQMMKLALDQQATMAESIRNEIRALENMIRSGRDSLDDRIRDFDGELSIHVEESQRRAAQALLQARVVLENAMDEKLDKKLDDKLAQRGAHDRIRTWAIALACTAICVWSFAATWAVVKEHW